MISIVLDHAPTPSVNQRTNHTLHNRRVDSWVKVMSHASAYYVILMTVSCTGDYKHPYFAHADNEEHAEEEPIEYAFTSTEF